MSRAETVRALLSAHTEMLARRDMTELASRIHAAADSLDSGSYTTAATAHDLLSQFNERALEVSSWLMGTDPDDSKVVVRGPIDIVDRRGKILGCIEIEHPDIDAMMWLSNNLSFAAAGHDTDPESPPRQRVRMRGLHPEPEWAAVYPYWTPDAEHSPELVRPADLDDGRSRLLETMTGNSHPNAALLSLQSIGARYTETAHDGISFTAEHPNFSTTFTIAGDDQYQVEVWLADHSTGTNGILTRQVDVPAQRLRAVVEDLLGEGFASGTADREHRMGMDATPPHPALIAAADLREEYAAPLPTRTGDGLAAAVQSRRPPSPHPAHTIEMSEASPANDAALHAPDLDAAGPDSP
ncbi:hypothetical protein [Nocardia suismassiliense]|uniref:hypothetical protein n=1 Tax=Nocardia suismassiliense TaxID=2077092 RepID=UPI00131F00F5|nr:hypothetical protein [Nocardia suismassiliense]